MRFTKVALATLMLAMTTGGVQADSPLATASAEVTINVIFTTSTCNITVPSSYNLGVLTPGSKQHVPLDITWICDGDPSVKTGLTAEIRRGNANGDEKVTLLTDDGSNTPTGAMLYLTEKGSPIKLTGQAAGNYFCSDAAATTGMRTCSLIPVTEVSQNGPFGLASATLSFEVGYP